MIRRLILILALAYASPVFAQAESAQIATAREIIARGGAQGVFEPMEDEHVTVRHVGSGLSCTFFLDDQTTGRVVLYDGAPRGEDVSCEMRGSNEVTSLYATRYAEGATIEDQLDGAEAAIRHRFSDARRIEPSFTMSIEGGAPHRARLYIVNIDGQRHLSLVSIAIVGEWVIKLRYTATAPDDEMQRQRELMAGAIMISALMKIDENPGSVVPGAGARRL